MTTVDLTQPASFAGAFAYEQTDIPPGQTITDWRRERTQRERAAKAARRAARRAPLCALVTLRHPTRQRGVSPPRPAGAPR